MKIAFDNSLAHKIEAGSDIYLMTSYYEPCGLNQLYSLKYGTLPIAYNTGGLADTIIDVDAKKGIGTGFKYYEYSKSGILNALDRAIKCFSNKKLWENLMKQAMACDFSWLKSAKEYFRLYQKFSSKET